LVPLLGEVESPHQARVVRGALRARPGPADGPAKVRIPETHTASNDQRMARPDYDFDTDKNAWLVRVRGISFEQIIALIEGGNLLRGL